MNESEETKEAVEVTVKATKKTLEKGVYVGAVGRRKTATARVRIFQEKTESITVNDKPYDEYFTTEKTRATVVSPFRRTEDSGTWKVTVHVMGGGFNAQAEAARHGIARALESFDGTYRSTLKKAGFLKRDPRKKERKKPGLKKARKAAQWSKR